MRNEYLDEVVTTDVVLRLEEAKHQFENWRQNKKSTREHIPQELWSIAVELTKTHTQSEVSKTLGLNASSLCNHRKKGLSPKPKPPKSIPTPSFIELNLESPIRKGHCTRIELERTDGHRLRMFSDQEQPFDIQEIIHQFLG